MEKETTALQIQLDREESRKSKTTRREIKFFLLDLQNGNVSDTKYRKTLINTLVDRIYLYDDGRLIMVCNNGDTTTEINFSLTDDTERDILATSRSEGYNTGDLRPPVQITIRGLALCGYFFAQSQAVIATASCKHP
jgi:hypothetical protein